MLPVVPAAPQLPLVPAVPLLPVVPVAEPTPPPSPTIPPPPPPPPCRAVCASLGSSPTFCNATTESIAFDVEDVPLADYCLNGAVAVETQACYDYIDPANNSVLGDLALERRVLCVPPYRTAL